MAGFSLVTTSNGHGGVLVGFRLEHGPMGAVETVEDAISSGSLRHHDMRQAGMTDSDAFYIADADGMMVAAVQIGTDGRYHTV